MLGANVMYRIRVSGCKENSEMPAALMSEAQYIKPIKKFMASLIRKQVRVNHNVVFTVLANAFGSNVEKQCNDSGHPSDRAQNVVLRLARFGQNQ